MSIECHDEDPHDRAAMITLRERMKLAPRLEIGPEGRHAFDERIARTPISEEAKWEADEVGGIPGVWCRPSNAVPDRAILYLHGGLYVLGSAAAYQGLASQIAARAKAATFIADYRLAPEHPFPAALEDARAALAGISEAGFRSIAVAGDSAGGGLALALLSAGGASSHVGAAALISPWIDLSLASDTIESRAHADPILSHTALQQGADQYLQGANPHDPRATALSGDPSRLPPIRIDVGEDEVLLADSLRFHAIADAADVATEVHVWKGMVHVFPANLTILKAAAGALDGIGTFLDDAFARRRAT